MTDRGEALQQAMERSSTRMMKAIKQHLGIESELTPLPPPDDPMYELIRAQHGIAEVRRRMRGM
ncbi:hypothetical protein [Streptomyces sp. NBC_00645]|uniref:hypothetical protein n=1 Tax=Streptomyces sp. NBC_00645 TaxID=2975795 RepID=UPI00324BEE7B